jgi:four helix bundle protein
VTDSFKDQMTRAATSVMNNSAEGFERRSSRDFGHFLDVVKASADEARSMLYLAEDRKYVSVDCALSLRDKAMGFSAGIAAFRRALS